MKLESRFCITNNGERIFGKGPCLLLEAIGRLGSLKKAANELNMSYSKAWIIINKAEQVLGYSLLQTHIGGLDGGGSYLTPEANTLIKAYNAFNREAKDSAEELYRKYLSGI